MDISLRDDGSESLVLADTANGMTIRVYCRPGVNDMPSRYASIGDEVRAKGEVSRQGSLPVLFATSDGITLVKDSKSFLTVEALSRNWALFLGDLISLSGLVIPSSIGGNYRLADAGLEQSIALASRSDDLAVMVGKLVSVEAYLRLLSDTMVLALEVITMSAGDGDNPFQSDR